MTTTSTKTPSTRISITSSISTSTLNRNLLLQRFRINLTSSIFNIQYSKRDLLKKAKYSQSQGSSRQEWCLGGFLEVFRCVFRVSICLPLVRAFVRIIYLSKNVSEQSIWVRPPLPPFYPLRVPIIRLATAPHRQLSESLRFGINMPVQKIHPEYSHKGLA